METVTSNSMFLESKDFCVHSNAVNRVGSQKVFALLFGVKECYPQVVVIDSSIFIQLMFTESQQVDRHRAKGYRRVSASSEIHSSSCS